MTCLYLDAHKHTHAEQLKITLDNKHVFYSSSIVPGLSLMWS